MNNRMTSYRRACVGCLLAASVAVALAGPASAAIITTASTTYDEQAVQTNAVDLSATGGVTVAQFKTDLANALLASPNGGGVITFDDVGNLGTTGLSDTVYQVNYGSGQTLTLTSQSPYDANSTSGKPTVNANVNQTQTVNISGANKLTKSGGTGYDGIFKFALSRPLSEVGMTVLTRTADRNVTLTAKLDDNTTITLNQVVAGATSGSNVNPINDTFFGVTAPAGRTIVGFEIGDLANPTTNFIQMDDIGFIVAVPEPASVGLLALGALALLARRR